jgi:hypothetical protein
MKRLIFLLPVMAAVCNHSENAGSQAQHPMLPETAIADLPPDRPGNYTIFGYYCGMCVKACNSFWLVDENGLFADRSGKFWETRDVRYFRGKGICGAEHEKTIALIKKIPVEFTRLDKGERQVGCPDCRDQCGLYLQITNGIITRSVFLDPEASGEPKHIMQFISDLRETVTYLNSEYKRSNASMK